MNWAMVVKVKHFVEMRSHDTHVVFIIFGKVSIRKFHRHGLGIFMMSTQSMFQDINWIPSSFCMRVHVTNVLCMVPTATLSSIRFCILRSFSFKSFFSDLVIVRCFMLCKILLRSSNNGTGVSHTAIVPWICLRMHRWNDDRAHGVGSVGSYVTGRG